MGHQGVARTILTKLIASTPSRALIFCILIIHSNHTSYLSFPLHRQDFQIQNFTPRNNSNLPQKSKICSFFAFNLEKFTPDRIFYTGNARGARDKYEVCPWPLAKNYDDNHNDANDDDDNDDDDDDDDDKDAPLPVTPRSVSRDRARGVPRFAPPTFFLLFILMRFPLNLQEGFLCQYRLNMRGVPRFAPTTNFLPASNEISRLRIRCFNRKITKKLFATCVPRFAPTTHQISSQLTRGFTTDASVNWKVKLVPKRRNMRGGTRFARFSSCTLETSF